MPKAPAKIVVRGPRLSAAACRAAPGESAAPIDRTLALFLTALVVALFAGAGVAQLQRLLGI